MSTSSEALLKWISSTRSSFSTMAALSTVVLHILGPVLNPLHTPVITTRDGQIQGKIAFSREKREYWQFLSIPYAQPPVGQLRYQPPVPVEPWKGVKQTGRFPPLCLQFDPVITRDIYGVEDCLFLSVFTPPFTVKGKKRPVLLHIHGGGFVTGGSRIHHPDYLMDQDMVVVTFNYRLGPLGFLNFEHDSRMDNVSLPRGNMGLKDQLLVLKWVQKNIGQFGGDKDKVTLMGESAGGVSVHLHVLSPKSRGLFHRAISHAGSAFSSWGFTTHPREVAYNYAKKWNCPLDKNSLLLKCLQNSDPYKMVEFQMSSADPTMQKDSLSPSVESVVTEDSFLVERPSDLMEKGNFPKIPFMFGVNSGEGGLRTARFEALPHTVLAMRRNWTQMLGHVLLFDRLPTVVTEQVREFYFGNATFPKNEQKFKDILNLLFSDVFAYEPVTRAAKGHTKAGGTTYLFYYDYKPKILPGIYSLYKACSPLDWTPCAIKIATVTANDWIKEHLLGGKGAHQYGVTHSEELLQLWNIEGVSKWLSGWDLQFSKSFVQVIADFVAGSNHLKFRGTPWPVIKTISAGDANSSSDVPLYMLMDNSGVGKVIPEPFADRLRFWERVGVRAFN